MADIKIKITFDNFTIRPICSDDVQGYFSFVDRNRERISKYFPKTISACKNIVSTMSHVSERIKLAKRKEFITLVISDNHSGEIIGTVFIKNLDWNIPKGEFGFFIDKNYERKGIITKSISFIIDYCFHTMGLNKIFMRIAEDNISSRRVAEKNGFIVEGILRSDFKTLGGNLIDVMYYGLLRSVK